MGKKRIFKTLVVFHTDKGDFREIFQSKGTPKHHIDYVISCMQEVLRQFDSEIDINHREPFSLGGDLANECGNRWMYILRKGLEEVKRERS